MPKKADIIKKDVILVTLKEVLTFLKDEPFNHLKQPEISIDIEYFDKCRLFNKTHSIKKDNWTYYCKNHDYYCALNYCLIIDISQKQKALEDFFKGIENAHKSDICGHKESIKRLENKIEIFKNIENETSI